MKKIGISIATVMLLTSLGLFGQGLKQLSDQLKRLNSDTALLIPSQAVDQYPIWSPDGHYLAANIQKKWFKVDLTQITLIENAWREGKRIGINSSRASISNASNEEIKAWQKTARMFPRRAVTSKFTLIELQQTGMEVSLVITKMGEKPVTVWTTDAEDCHSLTLSPDQSYVAFICEANGVVVFHL